MNVFEWQRRKRIVRKLLERDALEASHIAMTMAIINQNAGLLTSA